MTVYLGERALMKFFELSEHHDTMPQETILEIPQLQLSFEDRGELEKEDRAIIKSLQRKYSGPNSWPMFRAFRPGMLPWQLNEDEQQSMIHYLEQSLVVLSGTKSLDELIASDDPLDFLVRDYTLINGKPEWKNTFSHIQAMPPVEVPLFIPVDLLETIQTMPSGKSIYEADLFMTSAPIIEKGKPGYFPYLLILVDERSEFILGQEILNPSEGLEAMYSKVPVSLLKIIQKYKTRPFMIYTNSATLYSMCIPVMKQLNIRLEIKSKLPVLSKVKKMIMNYFSR
jgi:hypothetical protein